MLIENLMNKFGYSEMYEWSELYKYDIVPFGRFVTFSENEIGRIRLTNESDDYIVGVTTINSVMTSDDPTEWQGKYLCNEYGDRMLEESNDENGIERYGVKLRAAINPLYNESLTYKKRSERNEWVRVNLLGKCIVKDNGQCKAGQFCSYGNNGIAIPGNKYYVIGRISEDTIIILLK